MPVEMVAIRRCYDPDSRTEYSLGEKFNVPTDRAAHRLERGKKAVRQAALLETPASLKTMAAPEPAAPAESAKEEAAPEAPAHPQTYSRRDMQAAPHTGPTGQDAPSQSSRRGRRQNRPTSTS